MSRLTLWSLFLVAGLSVTAAAETLESAAFGSGSSFAELQVFRAPKMPPKVFTVSYPAVAQGPDEELIKAVAFKTASGGPVSKVVKEVELGPLLNRHLKTSLQFTMGGKSVWVSGAFDRAQSAYVSVLIDGQAAQFFNVKDLLTNPRILDIGTGKYKLSLSPDVVNQLDSEIVLTNAANRRDQQRITLNDMLDAVAAAGEKVDVTGQSYQVFYYDDVSGGTKSLCFILKDGKGQIHIFLVPLELVPTSGKPAVFKMLNSKAIGLLQVGGKLQISE